MQMKDGGTFLKENNPINLESDVPRETIFQKWRKNKDFPSGPMVGTLPSGAGGTGLIPDW